MAVAEDVPPSSLVTIPRAILSVAAALLSTVERVVIGGARMRTARGNAWEAMCADRACRQAREEMAQLVAALAVTMPSTGLAQRNVGSSPRSSAIQADLVSTGSAPRG